MHAMERREDGSIAMTLANGEHRTAPRDVVVDVEWEIENGLTETSDLAIELQRKLGEEPEGEIVGPTIDWAEADRAFAAQWMDPAVRTALKAGEQLRRAFARPGMKRAPRRASASRAVRRAETDSGGDPPPEPPSEPDDASRRGGAS